MGVSTRLFSKVYETELFHKIQSEIVARYHVDERLAQEMTWDFIDVLITLDSDLNLMDQYLLQ